MVHTVSIGGEVRCPPSPSSSRLRFTTNNCGQALVGAVPAEQFAEARMMGWLPLLDVPDAEFNEPMGPNRVLCDAIYEEAGITFADPNARLNGYSQCEEFMALRAAVDTGSAPLDQSRLVDDFASLGTRFPSVVVGPTRYATNRHFGVSRFRLAEFQADCTCFRYTTPWREIR